MSSPSARITDALWGLWTDRPVRSWLLGGIYARKSGYHSSRAENETSWPWSYSIQLLLDRQGPSDKAAAIDYTMSGAEMRRRTGYLVAAADRRDPRMAAVREFYGTADGANVAGRIKDTRGGSWRPSTSDTSHLWHIHISFFRAYVGDSAELDPVLSVLAGETLADWTNQEGGDVIPSGNPPLAVTDPLTQSARARDLQRALNELGEDLDVDGWYGPNTAAAVGRLQQNAGLTVDRIYGPNTEAALREALEDAMATTPEEMWEGGGYQIPMPDWVVSEFGLTDPEWRPRSVIRSTYGHARRASDRSARSIELGEAILAAVTGGDHTQIIERIDAHHAAQMARLGQAEEERARLGELVEQAMSGEKDAADVVALIAEILRSHTEPGNDSAG